MAEFKKNFKEKQVAFLDVNIFSHEGFTSGALIYMREILWRLGQRGIPAGVLSLAYSGDTKGKTAGRSVEISDGIVIEEYKLTDPYDIRPDSYQGALSYLLKGFNWSAIFMNSPAVHLEEPYFCALENALAKAENVIVVVPDVLYPTYSSHPKKQVARLYHLFQKAKVVVPSEFIRRRLFADSGIKSELLPNLFDADKVIGMDGSHDRITLINHHPMKGRDILNAIASKLPQEKFLVIENWPDVPDYVPPTSNVEFRNFFKDARQLYGMTKILLVPSLCEEGCPRVITEALLNGIQVIAHNIGGITEAGFGVIHKINAPPIKGEITMPRVEPADLEIQSDRFIREINNIQKKWVSGFERSEEIQNIAMKRIRQAEKITDDFITELFN